MHTACTRLTQLKRIFIEVFKLSYQGAYNTPCMPLEFLTSWIWYCLQTFIHSHKWSYFIAPTAALVWLAPLLLGNISAFLQFLPPSSTHLLLDHVHSSQAQWVLHLWSNKHKYTPPAAWSHPYQPMAIPEVHHHHAFNEKPGLYFTNLYHGQWPRQLLYISLHYIPYYMTFSHWSHQ